jgi:hypothetical protein
MARQVGVVLYVLALIAVVVSVDILFFRHHFTQRLIANVQPGRSLASERASRLGCSRA